jgi:hypothetical protein
MKRTITVPVEVTLYEPEERPDGSKSSTMFLLIGGGSYTLDGKEYPFGEAGGCLVTYLPGSRAIAFSVQELVRVGLEAVGEQESS